MVVPRSTYPGGLVKCRSEIILRPDQRVQDKSGLGFGLRQGSVNASEAEQVCIAGDSTMAGGEVDETVRM